MAATPAAFCVGGPHRSQFALQHSSAFATEGAGMDLVTLASQPSQDDVPGAMLLPEDATMSYVQARGLILHHCTVPAESQPWFLPSSWRRDLTLQIF